MTKDEFLATLHLHLSVLPPEERDELMEDYEAHFAFGMQNGKSEIAIARELGDPTELAKEAVQERHFQQGAIGQNTVYWGATEPPDRQVPHLSSTHNRRSGGVTTMIWIGLIFLNLIVAPCILSLWAAVVSIAVSAFAGLISPLALGLEYIIHGNVQMIQGYAAIILVGLGILLMMVSRYLIKHSVRLSVFYWHWNVRCIRGGRGNE